MIAQHLDQDTQDLEVKTGIETDRGPWVAALIAAGYTVFANNPPSVARYRQRHTVSGTKSDAADAHTLADTVPTDSHQLRPVAGDSTNAGAVKVVAQAHNPDLGTHRHTQRLHHALRNYFPAALDALPDLDTPDTLEPLGKTPDPANATRLAQPNPGRVETSPPPR
jgi:hypothetical protein